MKNAKFLFILSLFIVLQQNLAFSVEKKDDLNKKPAISHSVKIFALNNATFGNVSKPNNYLKNSQQTNLNLGVGYNLYYNLNDKVSLFSGVEASQNVMQK